MLFAPAKKSFLRGVNLLGRARAVGFVLVASALVAGRLVVVRGALDDGNAPEWC